MLNTVMNTASIKRLEKKLSITKFNCTSGETSLWTCNSATSQYTPYSKLPP